MDQPFESAQEDQQADVQAGHRAKLEQLLAMRLREAMSARETSGIEEIWIEDDDQFNGYDELNHPRLIKEPSDRTNKKKGKRSTIYLNITKPKTKSAVSRVQEMLVPHDDRPWEIGPTPVPELARAAAGEDTRMIMLADGREETAERVAKATIAMAQRSSERMANQIEDWFVEGSVYEQMRRVIKDAGRLGTGVLKGPFPVERRDTKWSVQSGVSRLDIVKRIAPTSKRISVWDLFPDPSCGDDIHAGGYIYERDYLTARKLRELARLPGYDRQAIAEILQAGPMRKARYDRHFREKDGETQGFDAQVFEVFYYYGDIPPEDLIACGYDIQGLLDAAEPDLREEQQELAMQLATVSVTVTVVNDRIVRVSQNPLETGEFPFDLFVWEPVEGQPWGRGVPRQMQPAQKILVSSSRAMLENAGMSAGPQVVTRKGVIEPWDGSYEITGRKGWDWVPSDEDQRIDDVRKVFGIFTIPSAQKELQAIIDFSLKMADELTNLPLLLQGMMGSAPDTVGGMEMLEANASSPLKDIAKQFDDGVIVRHLKRYYAWGMQDPNVPEDAKGDMQVKARGATALIMRERAGVFLTQAANLSKDPAYRISPPKLFAEYARSQKYDPTRIQYDDDEWRELQEQQAQQGAPVDPRIQAAQITAQAKQADREANLADRQQERAFKAREAELDRSADFVVKEIEREIQTMEFANNREVSLDQVKAMLSRAAMEIRNKREMFAAERQFAETEGGGRGL